MGRLKPLLLWSNQAVATVLMLMAVIKARYPDRGPANLTGLLGITWAVGALPAVTQVWSAYYYHVLSHPCPWCLFLPDYYGVGFFIFGFIAVVFAESVALWLVEHTVRRHPALADSSRVRRRQCALRIALALAAFTVLTAGPAICWRLGTGVWLDGSP
jgi:hypothetical protein